MDYDALLNLGTELGYKLVLSGAEIYRVEESVLRLLTAYGLQPQVFALPSCLIVSVNTPAGHPITQMRPTEQILNCWSGATISAASCAGRSLRCRRLRSWWESWGRTTDPTRPGSCCWVMRQLRPFLPRFTAGRCWIPCAAACAAWRWESGCCGPARAYALTTCFRP